MRTEGRFFTQRLVGWLAAWTLLTGILGLATPRPAAAQSNTIGINIASVSSYDTDRVFADAVKHSRPFSSAADVFGAALTGAAIDSNGWPTGDAGLVVWEGSANMNGTYRLQYTGAGSFTVNGVTRTISNQSYNSGTNTTTADVNISDTGNSTMWIIFTGISGGVKNVKFMRPTSPGATTSYATTTTFTDQMKNLIAKFSAIRFMDFAATNSNAIVSWNDRPSASYATQQPPAANYTTGWQGRGAAWEYAIQLCNETSKDAWICVPISADANYITQLATLFKNNLNSNLNVYVEYSNEVWNTAYAFQQSQINHNAAIAEVNAGGSPLNFDGETNDWYWAWRRVGKRAVEISNQFRTVFGDAAMGTRVRPVLEWQQGYAETGRQSLLMAEYLARQNNRAVNYYIYGGGGSAYYNPQNDSDTLTLSNIWTSDSFDVNNWAAPQRSDADWSAAYGIKRLAYEGGPSMDNIGHSEAIKSQAWSDTRMRGIVKGHQDLWSSYNGGLLMYFNSTGGGDYQWAFTDFPWNLNSQKLLGINDINGSSPAALVVGNAIPANVPGGAFGVSSLGYGYPGGGSGSVNIGNGTWRGWSVRNTTAGNYNVIVNFSSNGTGTLRFWSDGAIIGTYNFPNTGGVAQDSSTFAVSLSAGLHGLRVESTTGSFDVQQLKITSGATQVAAPTFSPGAGTYTAAQSVTISTTTSGASIRYTTDGSTPTSTTGTVYSAPVNVGSSLTLKAIAYKSGSTDSTVSSAAYTINIPGTTLPLRINVGGGAVSPFIADQYFSGGTTGTNTNTIDTSAANSAPAAVYNSERYGASTCTIPGLTAGNSYTVRLHFCENWFGAGNGGGGGNGSRLFNVAINGTTVLSNFDVHATAGGPRKALVRTFTTTANGSGQIVIAFTNGTANNAQVNGVEILAGSAPSAPTGLSATAGNAQISLSWTASGGATSYNVKRSTTNGGPYSTVSSPTGTSYTNTGLTNGTTYYYVVTAVNGNGESGNSNQASATPSGGPTTVTLNPTDDTDTQSDVAAGTNPEINASQWNTIFARFDFTGVTGTVTNAKFRIYKPYATSALSAILEQTTTDSWTQSNRGALPGVGATIQTIAAADAAGYIEFDVTALVQARMSGSKIVSFALNTPIGTWTSFQSKEGANKPQLVITKN